MSVEESVPAPTSEVMPSVTAGILTELWELMQRWYDVVADENYSDHTRNRYRECANELDELLARHRVNKLT